MHGASPQRLAIGPHASLPELPRTPRHCAKHEPAQERSSLVQLQQPPALQTRPLRRQKPPRLALGAARSRRVILIAQQRPRHLEWPPPLLPAWQIAIPPRSWLRVSQARRPSRPLRFPTLRWLALLHNGQTLAHWPPRVRHCAAVLRSRAFSPLWRMTLRRPLDQRRAPLGSRLALPSGAGALPLRATHQAHSRPTQQLWQRRWLHPHPGDLIAPQRGPNLPRALESPRASVYLELEEPKPSSCREVHRGTRAARSAHASVMQCHCYHQAARQA
mmetsp:Transcript_5651/g.14982  ORF Transcript_5651/g.14982 Transcript_5651/m.14982 type:complete len:274 (+) Transcript_5651:510-1331(+)